MRQLVAAFVLAVFVGLTAIDGVCCPDGCTQQGQPAGQEQRASCSAGACVLCTGGIGSSTQQELRPAERIAGDVASLISLSPVDAVPRSIEHPPRT